MLEELLVFGVVACAATVVIWRLLPGILRDTLGERCATLAQRVGYATADPEAAHRRASASKSQGCGGCTGCSTNPTPPRVAVISLKEK
ncbi:DUF6587 family protein [Accumulibacter sp.]|uniref:DUF6587 family protein n=1 Tax=Accumulibacter sp. TaxID=2053492 RepID=UPI0026253B09|nr:DUF6587 family protein [Accumulibacter sp.]